MIRWATQLVCVALFALAFSTANASVRYHVTLLCGRNPCALPVHAEMYPYARMLTYVTQVRLAIEPAPPVMPKVTWRVSDRAALTITNSHPFETMMRLPGDTAATPPPDTMRVFLMPGRFEGHTIVGHGAAIVSADIGPPVDERISFPVFSYDSLEVGCYFASENGLSFERPHARVSPSQSDLYVTGPTHGEEPFGNCGPDFGGSTSYTLHAPYGATLLATSDFAAVTPAQWRDTFREKALPLMGGVLLVKTRSGAIAKIQVRDENGSIEGRYLLSKSGRFIDTGLSGRLTTIPLKGNSSPVTFRAAIAYAEPPAATYGIPKSIMTEVPWPIKMPMYQPHTSVRVAVSPQPYEQPLVRWSVKGTSASVDSRGNVSGIVAGRGMLVANVGAPVNRTLELPVVTYDSLLEWCGTGIRFTGNAARRTNDIATSDLYISTRADSFDCHGEPRVFFAGGGTMVVNGGTVPQFPEIRGAEWRDDMTSLDIARYRRLAAPCMVQATGVMAGTERFDPHCTKRESHVLLFRTRDGRYVKWLLETGNGLSTLAGPYQVL